MLLLLASIERGNQNDRCSALYGSFLRDDSCLRSNDRQCNYFKRYGTVRTGTLYRYDPRTSPYVRYVFMDLYGIRPHEPVIDVRTSVVWIPVFVARR